MKRTTKLFLTAVGFFMLSHQANAQPNITIDASQNITTFRFVNSDGEVDKDYMVNYSGGYSLGYRYDLENGLFFPIKLGMRRAGATYIYDATNYLWDLLYTEARLGLGYKYSFGKFGMHISVTGYFAYLLKANQRINNEHFDILQSKQISTIDYGVIASPGINFTASEYISVYLDINYMMGLANLETDGVQKSNNTMYGATLGLAFTIK